MHVKPILYLLLLLGLIGSAGATTYTVGASGCDYTIIQDAVDAASSGDTVYVCNGSYTENVDIATAHLTIEGEGSDVVTVTAASNSDHVFYVTADYVNITGINVTGATTGVAAGIYLDSGVDHCNISDNVAPNNSYGIYLYSSSDNTITDNNASNNSFGVYMYSSSNNNLTNNTALSNTYGIYLYYSSSNNLTDNTLTNDDDGISLISSSNNTLADNNASNNNDKGIYIASSSDYNTLTSNTANSNTWTGVYLAFSSYNIFKYHTSNSNTRVDYWEGSTSLNNTLLDCDLPNGTEVRSDSTSQWIIRHTTSNITYYNDTTINQTISPTNVSTTIEPTVDDYVVTMTTLDDFSASTDVSTASLQLAEFASGGHSKFNVSSAEHTTVTTFNLGTFPVGQAVRLKRNKHGITCARAGASGIATFIYDGGYSDNEFETDPVGLYVYLNDTQNYTFTNDSYDAPAFTSQVTVTSAGSPPCAVSVEMPLITDSTYTELGYTVTNVTGGFSVTNASGWAAINFTVTNTTTIRISPSAGTKTSNLPATVVTGIGGVTVIVYLLRRRRR